MKYLGTVMKENFIYDGVNVFRGKPINRKCLVVDPLYNKEYEANIYMTKGKIKTHLIALAEFSNGIYGIYLIDD